MSEVIPTNNPKIEATVTNDSLPSDGLTWDGIEGTWDEHAEDTWDSPRQGMIKDKANEIVITNNPL